MDKEVTLKLQISQYTEKILTLVAKENKLTKEEIAKIFISKQIDYMMDWLKDDTAKFAPDWVESNTRKEIQ